jgi:hypothetical protein
MNLKDRIRSAGGIVHGDGNIFFTSEVQLLALVAEVVAEDIDAIRVSDNAAERERCAKLCEVAMDGNPHSEWDSSRRACAEAIRNQGEPT